MNKVLEELKLANMEIEILITQLIDENVSIDYAHQIDAKYTREKVIKYAERSQ